jgi:hypothetical protein
MNGPLLFAQFAYPPNALGYCGPEDSRALLDHAVARVDGAGLRALAQGFEGAWPYLQLIAAAGHIADPLDARVVEAYWLGNALLDRVPPSLLWRNLDERFRPVAGHDMERLATLVRAGAVPHHNFHVFSVYPWVGMLRRGHVDAPLGVLDSCRIRWGSVEAVVGDDLLVRARPLAWRDGRLSLDPPRLQRVTWRGASGALLSDPQPGDVVAMHWDWACLQLSAAQQAAVQAATARQLALCNAPGVVAAAAVLS